MSASANLALPFIEGGELLPDVTLNETLRLIDTLVQLAIVNRGPTPLDSLAAVRIEGTAGETLAAVVAELRRVRTLRRAACCLVVPALEPGFARAVFVAGGRVAAVRSVPPGLGARLEVEAGLAACRLAEPSVEPADVDELLLVGTFLRRPPPELRVCPLDAHAILAAATRAAAQAPAPAGPGRRPARPRAAGCARRGCPPRLS